ncbi:MAG TPA: hypothetical protein VJN94_09495 [Candidatus Binataceae bacterium]|nr:hypothetical protein [Candidatus Binataceae bacterium]
MAAGTLGFPSFRPAPRLARLYDIFTRALSELVGLVLVVAVLFVLDRQWGAHFFPLRQFSLMSVIALLFPITACAYLRFEVRTRKLEIFDSISRRNLHRVYFSGATNANQAFDRLLENRFRQYYSPIEMTLFAVIASAIVFIIEYALAMELNIVGTPPALLQLHQLQADQLTCFMFGAGFFGSVAGALAVLVRKYRSFDLYPSTYLQLVLALLLGTLATLFLVPAFARSTTLLAPLFAVGFFIANSSDYFNELMRQWLKASNMALPAENAKSDLEMVVRNPGAVESIKTLGLWSVAELARANLLTLYFNLAQPIGVVDEWVDQALLFSYMGPDGTKRLQAVGIISFTQILQRMVEKLRPDGATGLGEKAGPRSIEWKGGVRFTDDAEFDQHVAAAIQDTVASCVHHVTLAFLWRQYAEVFFPKVNRAIDGTRATDGVLFCSP